MKKFALTAAVAVSLAIALTSTASAWFSAYWQTPSRNIRCVNYTNRLVCGTLNDGYTITLYADGVTRVRGNVYRIPRGPVLQYGETWTSKRNGIKCWSDPDGLTCENDYGHGFFLNRDDVERW